jgi:flavin-binding protein dodecin
LRSPLGFVDRSAAKGARMSVEKSIDLTATGASIEEAVSEAVHRASLTLRGVTSFEIERIEGIVEGEDISYRVLVRIAFVIKEQIHE